MRTFIKLPLIYLLLLFAGSLFITSCQDDDDYYSIGDYLVSFGVVEKVSENAEDNLVVRLDNGDKAVSIVPIHHHHDDLTVGKRVLINFAPYDDQMNKDSSMTYFGKFNSIKNILYKDILKLSEIDNDSIGNDPVVIHKSWLTGDSILNIKFSYYTHGSTHYINMVDNGSGNGVNTPYLFEFRHNDRGDSHSLPAYGYVSFKLNPIKVAGQTEVDFKVRYTDYDGKTTEIPYTINY